MAGKTLEQIEHDIWPEPSAGSSLIVTCHRLRKKPLDLFTAEDLRIMIGQQIGLNHLMPMAIKVLETNPFIEGDYSPGDLLSNVIANDNWLQKHPEMKARVINLAKQAMQLQFGNQDEQDGLIDLLTQFVCQSQNRNRRT